MNGDTANAVPLKIMLAAVEPSADKIGAELLRELKAKAPAGTRFYGCGGRAMAAAGFESLFPIDALSVMGFTDVARAMPEGFRRAGQLSEFVRQEKIDAAVFIDGWAFSRICAKRMRKAAPETTLIKFAAPQVWASRPQRIDFVRRHFDGVLTLLPFEPPLFEAAGVKAEFIGNPNFQKAWRDRGDGGRFRARHGLGDAPLLAVLLGSRRAELKHLAEPFREAVTTLASETEGLRLVVPLADQIATEARAELERWTHEPIIVDETEKSDALAAATAALAVSGTISTEIAINKTPLIVAYKVDALTAFWARRVVTTKYASIINVAANREIIPEFIQDDVNALSLARALKPLLTDANSRRAQLDAFPAILDQLGVNGPSAASQGAEKILEWISYGDGGPGEEGSGA